MTGYGVQYCNITGRFASYLLYELPLDAFAILNYLNLRVM